MDDFDEESLEEAAGQAQQAPPSSFNGFGSFGYNDNRHDDIKAINDRTGKNDDIRKTDEDYGQTSKREKRQKEDAQDSDEITGKSKNGKDELAEQTDGKSSKDKLSEDRDDKDQKDKEHDESPEKEKQDKEEKEENKEDEDDSSDSGYFERKFKRLWRKYKVYIIAGLIGLGFFLLVLLINVIMAAIDTFTLSISNFFGVPEGENEEKLDSLYEDDTYLKDAEGNTYTYDELISNLNDGSNCKSADFLTSLSDKWKAFTNGGFSDTCELLRYIKDKSKEATVDEALIISTLYYGYNTKPSAGQYENPSSVSEDETTASEHYEMLVEILTDKDNNIKRSTIDEIIKYSKATDKEYFYLWTLEETKDSNGKVTKITGRCVRKEKEDVVYTLDKWRVFMRFGSEAADAFDDAVLKNKSYLESSDECKNTDGVYTMDALEAQVKAAAGTYDGNVSYSLDTGSISAARNDLENMDPYSAEAFYQYADIYSKTQDVFKSFNGIVFDYKNGFAYNNFPGFKSAIENPNINIYYDSIFTPKEIEQVIQDIVDKKRDINSALLRKDPDDTDYTYTQNYGTSGVTGAKCMPYLTASYDQITVKLTDCYGTPMTETTFEDYIIGVTNLEISNTHDQAIITQMIAAISYALARRGNYSKGNVITMRSGTCDQAYCNMKIGCYGKNTPVGTCNICNSYYQGGSTGKNPHLYAKFQALYAIAINYLVIKGDKVYETGYVDTNQKQWISKANQGKSFTQIINEEYGSKGAQLIKCSDSSDTPSNDNLPDEDDNPVGNKATTEYPEVAPDKGNFYGFSYKNGTNGTSIEINPVWKDKNIVTISPKCNGNEEFSRMQFNVHEKAVKNFEKAFEGVCRLLTEGVKLSDGSTCKYTMNDLADGTVFFERKTSAGTLDLHPYGLAQDWNYSKRYTINGKEYTPYNTYNLADYKEFVNAIGGKEENCQNVNYILWLKAYKDAGFKWGGNVEGNETTSYNGKLFELVYE